MSGGRLRMITYLSPGIPVELFETVLDYLEQQTGCEGHLIYESRWPGPPKDRTDPFTADDADIGFMESTDFLRLAKTENCPVELCQAGACFVHQKAADRPVYYSDIIVNKSTNSKFKEFHDLRGHSLAYNSGTSLSGASVLLEHLKKLGVNVTFFGNTRPSGSHLNSIAMVLDNKVDTAAVDSNVLQAYLAKHPEHRDSLVTLLSLGPLPTYPIVLNKKLPDDLKKKITESLLKMSKSAEWSSRLSAFNVSGFVPCDMSLYDMETSISTAVKGLSIGAVFY